MSMVLSNRPLLITLAVYFLIELVDEILLASAGLIAAQYFDWGVLQTGAFLALLGVLVLPANFLISEAAGPLEDRTILIASEVVTVIGLLTILSYWGNYSVRGPLMGGGGLLIVEYLCLALCVILMHCLGYSWRSESCYFLTCIERSTYSVPSTCPVHD
jgi:hypothetical protein